MSEKKSDFDRDDKKLVIGKGKVTLFSREDEGGEEEKKPRGVITEDLENEVDSKLLERFEHAESVSPTFQKFVREILLKVSFEKTSLDLLESFSNIDVTAEKVSAILDNNPYYRYFFSQVLKANVSGEDQPSVEAGVGLMGIQKSRNWLVALQLDRMIYDRHPSLDENGMFKIDVTETLKFSLKAEEVLGGKKENYSDTGFAAGVLFDLFRNIAIRNGADAGALKYIEEHFEMALRAGKVGIKLAKDTPGLGENKYIFSGCVLTEIGKVAFVSVEPAYLTFYEKAMALGVPQKVLVIAEKEKFGVDHLMLGSAICQSYKVFEPIEKAVRYFEEPYLLSRHKSLYMLSLLMSLSSNISRDFKQVTSSTDSILQKWKGPELKDLNIAPDKIIQSIKGIT